MRVYNRVIAGEGTDFWKGSGTPQEAVLYLDIETTGLSAEHSRIYLIGCAYWQQPHWNVIQWFDETGTHESDILTSFLIFARQYKVLVHYNGERFDLPFLRSRITADGLAQAVGGLDILNSLHSIDLFRAVRPFKTLLSLENLRQQTLEHFMGTGRTEDTSGSDLIKVYTAYLSLGKLAKLGAGDEIAQALAVGGSASNAAPASSDRTADHTSSAGETAPMGYLENVAAMEQVLLGHNAADVHGLLGITPVLLLPDVVRAIPNVYKAQANHYKGFDGTPQEEIVLYCRLRKNTEPVIFPRPISAARDGCYLHLEGNTLTLKIPLVHGELKFFYANYQDYYYLPMEDMALHKSIAAFVERSHRVQATAATCYTRKSGDFLPEWEQFRTPFFKKDYKDKYAWFEFKPEMKKDKAFFNEYAAYVYRHIIGKAE